MNKILIKSNIKYYIKYRKNLKGISSKSANKMLDIKSTFLNFL